MYKAVYKPMIGHRIEPRTEPRISVYKRYSSTARAVDNSLDKPVSNPVSNYWIVVSNFMGNFLLSLLRKMICFFRDSEPIDTAEDVETDTVIDGWDKYGKPYFYASCFYAPCFYASCFYAREYV